MKRNIALALLFVLLLALAGCQTDEYKVVESEKATEYLFAEKNIKVVEDADGCRVVDMDGVSEYQYEIVGFKNVEEALGYAREY